MSERIDYAAKLRKAAEHGNVDAARDAWQSLRNQPHQSLLSDLSAAIEEDRLEDARILFGRVQNQIQERRRDTETTTAAVRAVRNPENISVENVDSIESVENLTDYLLEAERTNSQRLLFLSRVGAYLTAPDADRTPDGPTVLNAIDQTAQREEAFDETTTDVETAIDGQTIPASLAGLDVELSPRNVSAGATTSLSASVTNVGDQTAQGVTLTLDLPSEVSTTEDITTIGSVSPDETSSATVDVVPSETGEFPLNITVTSARAGTVAESVVLIATESDDQTGSNDGENEQTEDESSDDDKSADDGGSGFGVPAGLASISGVTYILKSRLNRSDEED